MKALCALLLLSLSPLALTTDVTAQGPGNELDLLLQKRASLIEAKAKAAEIGRVRRQILEVMQKMAKGGFLSSELKAKMKALLSLELAARINEAKKTQTDLVVRFRHYFRAMKTKHDLEQKISKAKRRYAALLSGRIPRAFKEKKFKEPRLSFKQKKLLAIDPGMWVSDEKKVGAILGKTIKPGQLKVESKLVALEKLISSLNQEAQFYKRKESALKGRVNSLTKKFFTLAKACEKLAKKIEARRLAKMAAKQGKNKRDEERLRQEELRRRMRDKARSGGNTRTPKGRVPRSGKPVVPRPVTPRPVTPRPAGRGPGSARRCGGAF